MIPKNEIRDWAVAVYKYLRPALPQREALACVVAELELWQHGQLLLGSIDPFDPEVMVRELWRELSTSPFPLVTQSN